MRSVVIIGRKSIERMLGLLCIIAATLIFGMSVKAAGPEEVAYVYLDEDVVGTSGVQNIVVGFHKEEMVIGGARLFYQTESGTEGIVEAAQILNNTVLFQKEGMEEIGTYQITGIAYLDGAGAEQMILFAEKGITASFQVVQDEALFVPEKNSTGNAKSVLSILGACVKSGDEVEFIFEGEDEEAAAREIIEMIESGLGE